MILDKDKINLHVKAVTDSMKKLSSESSSAEPTAEQVQGFTFDRGEEVIDRATGKKATVIAGQRASIVVQVP